MPRSIVRLGHPALRFPAAAVEIDQLGRGELEELLTDLRRVLGEAGAPALTAPQLGVELQLLAFRQASAADAAGEPSLKIVINPMLEPEHGDLVYDWEKCVSIPDLRGLVPRYPVVRLRGVDERGKPVDLRAEGKLARILQHAHDHLSGVVFLDRMGDLRSLAFVAEWRRYLSEAADEELA